MNPTKTTLVKAMQLAGFENWRPKVDVPKLHRPRHRPSEMAGEGRSAAVMLLLYSSAADERPKGQAGRLKLILTKRHAKLASHAGQISFPGGQQDNGESLWQTAVRETFEEIGVGGQELEFNGHDGDDKARRFESGDSPSNERIELLGQLNPVYIPPSDFTVSPFVAWLNGTPKFVRSEEEVDEIIEVPLDHLLKPEVLKYGEIKSASGMKINVPYFEVETHQVWGATAIILGELIERIRLAGVKWQ